MTTITIDPQRTVASAATVPISTSATTSNNPLTAPRGMPASVPADELYYWTEAWQAGEQETRRALARGEGRVYDSAKDVIRDLLTND